MFITKTFRHHLFNIAHVRIFEYYASEYYTEYSIICLSLNTVTHTQDTDIWTKVISENQSSLACG